MEKKERGQDIIDLIEGLRNEIQDLRKYFTFKIEDIENSIAETEKYGQINFETLLQQIKDIDISNEGLENDFSEYKREMMILKREIGLLK